MRGWLMTTAMISQFREITPRRQRKRTSSEYRREEKLKERIEGYWLERGLCVRITIEPLSILKKSEDTPRRFYKLVSETTNGWPCAKCDDQSRNQALGWRR